MKYPTCYTSSNSSREVSIHVVSIDSGTRADWKARTHSCSLCTSWPTAVTFLRSIVCRHRDSDRQLMKIICCGSWRLLKKISNNIETISSTVPCYTTRLECWTWRGLRNAWMDCETITLFLLFYDWLNFKCILLFTNINFKAKEKYKSRNSDFIRKVYLLAEASSFSSSDQTRHWFCYTFPLFLESTQIAAENKSQKSLI